MNVLSRELRGLLAQESRLLTNTVRKQSASPLIAGASDSDCQSAVAWAQRVMPRSTGWKLAWVVLELNRGAVFDALLANLSKLPFQTVEMLGDFSPPYEPPYEPRSKDVSAEVVQHNSCIEQLIHNGLQQLDARNFDLDPVVLATWSETTAKHATSLKLESVARMDSEK